jgi:hypothetical protein
MISMFDSKGFKSARAADRRTPHSWVKARRLPVALVTSGESLRFSPRCAETRCEDRIQLQAADWVGQCLA